MGHEARTRQMRNVYKICVGEGNEPLGILSRKFEDIIKLNLKEMVLEDVDWIHLSGVRL
jgi:hypothetical protein